MKESFIEMSKRLAEEQAARAQRGRISPDMLQRKANGEAYAFPNEAGTGFIPGELFDGNQSADAEERTEGYPSGEYSDAEYSESSQYHDGEYAADGSYTAPQEDDYSGYNSDYYEEPDYYENGYSEPQETPEPYMYEEQPQPEQAATPEPPAAASQTQQQGEAVESVTLGDMSKEEKSFPKVFHRKISDIPKRVKKWLLKRWLPKGPSVGFMYGASGCGKTTLALYWAVIIAYGFTLWKGYKINGSTEGRHVFYICSEGEEYIWQRITGILYYLGLPENALDGKLFPLDGNRYFSDEISGISNHYLTNPDACKLLQNDIADIVGEGGSADLIIIDTFNGFFGEEEAANDKIGKFINNLKNYLSRPFKANVMIIHHVNLESTYKTASEILPRGGSATFSDTDYAIACATRNGPERGIEMFLRKQKDGKQHFFEYVQARMVEMPPEVWPPDDDELATALVIDDTITSDEAERNLREQYSISKETGERTKKQNAEEWKLQILNFIELGTISAERLAGSEEAYRITSEEMKKALLNMNRNKARLSTELKPYDGVVDRGVCARLDHYGYLDINPINKKGNSTVYEYIFYPKRNNSDKE